MSVSLSPPMFLQFFVPGTGQPAVGYQLFTYIAGTSTKQATWTDSTQITQSANPIIADGNGVMSFWLDPTLTYKFVLAPKGDTDPPTSPIYSVDNISPNITAATLTVILTQSLLGSILYPRTPAEVTAGVIPTNLVVPSHTFTGIINPERYGVNTTPGSTDMSTAWNQAILVSLATSGSGKLGCPIRWVGVHNIANPLNWGSLGTNIVPVEVAGYGIASQLICNTTASSGALFPLDSLNGWYLHDFLMCGNSAHKNDGIHAGNVSATEAIEWRVERVISLMAGVGLKIQNTNTGWVNGFAHWPGNNPALIVPQTVTNSDINHGIYMTGSFVHNVRLDNVVCLPNANYAPGQRGIKCDATTSFGVTITMPIVQTLSGNGTEIGIDYNCSSSANSLTVQGCYHEGTILSFQGVNQSNISCATDGGAGGAIVFASGTRNNKLSGCNIGVLDIVDSTCLGNSIDCCGIRGPQAWSAAVPYLVGNYVTNGGVNYKCIANSTNNAPPNVTFWSVFSPTGFNDATEGNNLSGQPTRITNSFVEGYGNGLPDLGNNWRKLLTITANVATPDTYNASWNVLRVQAATLTVNTPLHPRNGQRLGFTIRNETVGAITVTWGGGFNAPPWTNPGTGQKRSIEFMYDSDFAEWNFLWYSNADAPN
jgi:hypothetical protein